MNIIIFTLALSALTILSGGVIYALNIGALIDLSWWWSVTPALTLVSYTVGTWVWLGIQILWNGLKRSVKKFFKN